MAHGLKEVFKKKPVAGGLLPPWRPLSAVYLVCNNWPSCWGFALHLLLRHSYLLHLWWHSYLLHLWWHSLLKNYWKLPRSSLGIVSLFLEASLFRNSFFENKLIRYFGFRAFVWLKGKLIHEKFLKISCCFFLPFQR